MALALANQHDGKDIRQPPVAGGAPHGSRPGAVADRDRRPTQHTGSSLFSGVLHTGSDLSVADFFVHGQGKKPDLPAAQQSHLSPFHCKKKRGRVATAPICASLSAHPKLRPLNILGRQIIFDSREKKQCQWTWKPKTKADARRMPSSHVPDTMHNDGWPKARPIGLNGPTTCPSEAN